MEVDCMSVKRKVHGESGRKLCEFPRRPHVEYINEVKAVKSGETGSIYTFKNVMDSCPQELGGVFPVDKELLDSVASDQYLKTGIKNAGKCYYSVSGVGVEQNDVEVKKAADKACKFGVDGQLTCQDAGLSYCEYVYPQ
uniref:X8 domain-containing protein n=2 Tax=Bursaphelenchus xylophilus TaxID=6326 RepID=A0A1I7SDK8_BURXY